MRVDGRRRGGACPDRPDARRGQALRGDRDPPGARRPSGAPGRPGAAVTAREPASRPRQTAHGRRRVRVGHDGAVTLRRTAPLLVGCCWPPCSRCRRRRGGRPTAPARGRGGRDRHVGAGPADRRGAPVAPGRDPHPAGHRQHARRRAGRAAGRHAAAHARVPAAVDLWTIRTVNPDGTAADRRTNAHGVDLNRNFPRRWRLRRHGHVELVGTERRQRAGDPGAAELRAADPAAHHDRLPPAAGRRRLLPREVDEAGAAARPARAACRSSRSTATAAATGTFTDWLNARDAGPCGHRGVRPATRRTPRSSAIDARRS